MARGLGGAHSVSLFHVHGLFFLFRRTSLRRIETIDKSSPLIDFQLKHQVISYQKGFFTHVTSAMLFLWDKRVF